MATYRERLNPPLSWMSFIFFMYFSMAFAIWAAFDFLEALIFLIVLSATLPYLWIKMRMVITVDTELRIDRAHIELKYLKEPREIDETEYRKLRTFNSDARSFHATRPWLNRGVQVFVNDERDKTSYWLIGSNNSGELVKRIRGIQP
jgi:hypothetical protein